MCWSTKYVCLQSYRFSETFREFHFLFFSLLETTLPSQTCTHQDCMAFVGEPTVKELSGTLQQYQNFAGADMTLVNDDEKVFINGLHLTRPENQSELLLRKLKLCIDI